MILNPAVALHALANDEAEVYERAGDHLRNVTGALCCVQVPPCRCSRARLVVGKPLYSYLLARAGWVRQADEFRWMQEKGRVSMGQPIAAGARLTRSGYCTKLI